MLVVGYLAWIYGVTAITSITQIVMGELRQGTFYKKYHSVYPLHILLFGRMIASLLVQSFVVLAVVIVAKIVGNISVGFHLVQIVAIAVSTLGMYGIGLIVAGMSIFHKRTGSVLYIIQLCLLFVTDTVPMTEDVINVTQILPLTICNAVIRKSIAGMSYGTDFIKLLISAVVMLGIGLIVFHVYLEKARMKGNLLFY